jgi:hypothetical protein
VDLGVSSHLQEEELMLEQFLVRLITSAALIGLTARVVLLEAENISSLYMKLRGFWRDHSPSGPTSTV